jgi:hypothetical protein
MNEPSKEEQELENSLDKMGFFILLFVVLFFIGLFIYSKIFLKEEMKENAKYQNAINQLEVFAVNQKEINIKIAEEYFEKTENHILNKGLYKDIVDENGNLLNSIIEKFENNKEEEIEVEIIVDNSFLKEFKEKNLEEIKAKIYDLAKKNNYGFLNQKEEKINFVKGLENYLVNYIQIGRSSSISFKKNVVYLKQSDKEEISIFYKELMRLFPNREFYFTKNGELMVSAYENGIFETNFGGEVYGKKLRKGTKIILTFTIEK